MRLIDADALIEHIKRFYCPDCNNYNGVRCRVCQYDDEMADIDSAPTVFELPDNPTNGDVIKAIFPNKTTVHDVEWWNSPYKKEIEK